MSIAPWCLLSVAVAACAPRLAVAPPAAATYPAKADSAPAAPAPTAPQTHERIDQFQAFQRESPLPASLTHGSFSLTDWHSEPQRPSPIATRGQLPIGQAHYPAWADLLSRVHSRVHPLFADEYLPSLDQLPPESPLKDLTLSVELELHIAEGTGELTAIGLRRSSGQPELDIAAIAAFSKAFPLPIPPGLASTDGELYLTWEVRRDQTACSTVLAHPYRLK